ncbi:MAG: hypothetical protein AAF902_10870 [Chloroflexota bacterium]
MEIVSIFAFACIIPIAALSAFGLIIYLIIKAQTPRVGVWGKFAEKYHGEIPPEQVIATFNRNSGSVGMHYNGALNFTLSENELGVSAAAIYAIGHKPFKIPFEEITAVEKHKLFFGVHLLAEQVPGKEIKISAGLAQQIEKASNGKWTYERKG